MQFTSATARRSLSNNGDVLRPAPDLAREFLTTYLRERSQIDPEVPARERRGGIRRALSNLHAVDRLIIWEYTASRTRRGAEAGGLRQWAEPYTSIPATLRSTQLDADAAR